MNNMIILQSYSVFQIKNMLNNMYIFPFMGYFRASRGGWEKDGTQATELDGEYIRFSTQIVGKVQRLFRGFFNSVVTKTSLGS